MFYRWHRREARARLLLAAFVILSWGLLAGSAHAGTITVMWDLNVETNVTGYRVFVGTSPGLPTESFDVDQNRNFYIYRTAYNGRRYYFSVAAQVDGSTYGPRSGEVSAVGTRVVAGGLPGDARLDGLVTADRDGLISAAACEKDCFEVRELASGLADISSVAASMDGALFLVEDGQRIRVFAGQAAGGVSALTADVGTRFLQAVLDPHFPDSRHVFVSQVLERAGARAELSIVRYRYLGGALAEPAVVVAGLPAPPDGLAPFTVSSEGQIYLATPSADPTAPRDPYAGAVLVFNRDGSVPATQTTGSPILAGGVGRPAAIGWDASGQRVWLAGAGPAAALLSVASRPGAVPVPPRVTLQSSLAAGGVIERGGEITALALTAAAPRGLVLATERGLSFVSDDLSAGSALHLSLADYGSPVAIAIGPAGETYVAVRAPADRAAAGFALLRISFTTGSAPAF